jgi:acyl-CoA synthetase (AMP-forming)/AMP-acid ligase II
MFRAQLDSLGEMLNLRPGLVDVQAFAAFAMYDICAGMCSVLPKIDMSRPAAADPAEIVAAINAHAPERAFGSPIIWHKVGRYCLANGIRLPSLRIVLTVGAPVPAYLHRQFQEILSNGAEMLTPYGATEALPVTCIGSSEILEDTWKGTTVGLGTCVGRPAPGIDIRIIAITDQPIERWCDDLALVQGEVGEVVVGGLQVSSAYDAAPESNRLSKIRHGNRLLHRMGDIGYLDAQGRLWFCGRKVERLETKEGVVAPVPVEGVFNEHPDVFRTALVGVGDPGGQIPVLCVEMEPGRHFTRQTVDGLRDLAKATEYAGLVKYFLPHHEFPTDARRGWPSSSTRAHHR